MDGMLGTHIIYFYFSFYYIIGIICTGTCIYERGKF